MATSSSTSSRNCAFTLRPVLPLTTLASLTHLLATAAVSSEYIRGADCLIAATVCLTCLPVIQHRISFTTLVLL